MNIIIFNSYNITDYGKCKEDFDILLNQLLSPFFGVWIETGFLYLFCDYNTSSTNLLIP